jgi:hypothetical protein
MEVLPDSSLPDDLANRGYDVQPAVPAEGERIIPAWAVETILIEGSTVGAIRTSHASIARVWRYVFQL